MMILLLAFLTSATIYINLWLVEWKGCIIIFQQWDSFCTVLSSKYTGHGAYGIVYMCFFTCYLLVAHYNTRYIWSYPCLALELRIVLWPSLGYNSRFWEVYYAWLDVIVKFKLIELLFLIQWCCKFVIFCRQFS